jgi:alpha-glucosidase
MFLLNVLLVLGATIAAAWEPQPSAWWKEGVVYQIYPASFKESRTEGSIGWGDIQGITDKLDHIQSLGADIVWLSPFYESPMKDMGYDISDYDSVDPLFGGSLEDIKTFIEEVHKRGMRCIFDLVINHTSDKHKWFKESASSKTNPKRDWFFWRQPQYKNGSMYPPNNWEGNNNGSAWKYDAHTGEYYLNIFNYFQPDLNWDNPDTRQAILQDALQYWLDMGIDGFRMDVFARYSKATGLPDVPANDSNFYDATDLYTNGPHEHEYLQQMNREVLSRYDIFTVGEYTTEDNMTKVQDYISASRHEVNTVFLTNMCDIGREGSEYVGWNLTGWRDAISFTQRAGSSVTGDGWNSIYLENHDLPRSISRFANDAPEYRVQGGKALSVLLSTLSGTLFVYQGQEIGMINVPDTWNISDYRDSSAIEYYKNATQNGVSSSKALAYLASLSRDNSRTPFNWDGSGRGFSTNKNTWISQTNLDINLADQKDDPRSIYSFWVEMLRLRKEQKDLFVYGEFEFLDWEDESFLVYQKTTESDKVIVFINLSTEAGETPVPIPKDAKLLAYTHEDHCGAGFEPFEARVYKQ